VVSYWKGKRCIFHNYVTAVRVTGPPVIADVLHHLDRWRRADDIVSAVPNGLELLERLSTQTLLDCWEGGGSPPTPVERAWDAWEPVAGLMHFATKDTYDTHQDLERAQQRLDARAGRLGEPETCKRSSNGPAVQLRRPRGLGAMEVALSERRTWREFGARPVSLRAVTRLLWWVWGVRRWLVEGPVRTPLRSSPSSGGKQVLEVYVVAKRVSGLEPGFYHYEMDRHRLVRLPGRVSARTLERLIPRQWWFHDAAALFVMSAVFKRLQLRYPFPRAYRSVLLEAGHFCQTFCLYATALRLAPFCTHALADTAVEGALGLDGIDESVVYAAGVGHRPPGRKWRPWPDHEPGHQYRPPKDRRAR
jgi:SagB-type dehydrogenase family enzyme